MMELSMRADAAQLQHRKLRQSFLDMGYGISPKAARAPRREGEEPPPGKRPQPRKAS
jgi:hypothetical protein